MPATSPFARWKVVALCFLSQNMAMGLAFGSFGPLLASTEAHFGVSRAVATTGMSFMMLAVGVLAPLLGGLVQTISVRSAMMAGASLSALGYATLGLTPWFPLALLAFAIIGAGICLGAILGPLMLVSRWFPARRGSILGIVNLPIALFLCPYLIAALLPDTGRAAILIGIALLFLTLIPLLLSVADRPPDMAPASAVSGSSHGLAEAPLTLRAILANRPFWLLSLGIGIMAGSGAIFVVHIIAFGMERSMSLQAAAALLSLYAGAGILGNLLFGRIADRIGAPTALVLSSLCQALIWLGLLYGSGATLYPLAALLGICIVPLTTLHGAALGELFSVAGISRAMGASYGVKLPFLFAAAPLAGWLFDIAGGYRLPFLVTAGAMALSCLLFILLAMQGKGSRQPLPS